MLSWTYTAVVTESSGLLGLALLAAIGFFVFAAHVQMVGAAPIDYGSPRAASSATGLVDGMGYVGAGCSGAFTGLIVDSYGWTAGLWFWVIAAFFSAILMFVLWQLGALPGRDA